MYQDRSCQHPLLLHQACILFVGAATCLVSWPRVVTVARACAIHPRILLRDCPASERRQRCWLCPGQPALLCIASDAILAAMEGCRWREQLPRCVLAAWLLLHVDASIVLAILHARRPGRVSGRGIQAGVALLQLSKPSAMLRVHLRWPVCSW